MAGDADDARASPAASGDSTGPESTEGGIMSSSSIGKNDSASAREAGEFQPSATPVSVYSGGLPDVGALCLAGAQPTPSLDGEGAAQSPFGPADDHEDESCLAVEAPRSAAEAGPGAAPPRPYALPTARMAWRPAASVSVGAPEKHGEGFLGAHVSYEVRTRWPARASAPETEYAVRRRYRDFVWLADALGAERDAGAVVPPLPARGGVLAADRFHPEFVRRRQEALCRFLQRVLAHPRLSAKECLRAFLTAETLSCASPSPPNTRPSASASSLFDPGNMPVPEDHGEEAFLVMRRAVGAIESHYRRVADLHGRMMRDVRALSDAAAAAQGGAHQMAQAVSRLEAVLADAQLCGGAPPVDASALDCVLRPLLRRSASVETGGAGAHGIGAAGVQPVSPGCPHAGSPLSVSSFGPGAPGRAVTDDPSGSICHTGSPVSAPGHAECPEASTEHRILGLSAKSNSTAHGATAGGPGSGKHAFPADAACADRATGLYSAAVSATPEKPHIADNNQTTIPSLGAVFESVEDALRGIAPALRALAERCDYEVAARSSEFAACCHAARAALRLSDTCRTAYRAACEGVRALEREYAALTDGGVVPDAPTSIEGGLISNADASISNAGALPNSLGASSHNTGAPPSVPDAGAPRWASSLSSFFSGAMLRPRDASASRLERASRLRARISVARTERRAAGERMRAADAAVQAEFASFSCVLDAEFRDVFVASIAQSLSAYRRAERDVLLRAFPAVLHTGGSHYEDCH